MKVVMKQQHVDTVKPYTLKRTKRQAKDNTNRQCNTELLKLN